MRVGGRARVVNLARRTDLNGTVVTLLRWDATVERWCVKCESTGEGVKVRASNLAPLTSATTDAIGAQNGGGRSASARVVEVLGALRGAAAGSDEPVRRKRAEGVVAEQEIERLP